MLGAIIGDIVGSRFEFDRGDKSREFELFTDKCEFTDDTVMTIAVAEALMNAGMEADEKTIKDNLIKSMKTWGQKYPDSGYGARFIDWVLTDDPKPYGSLGNGSGMRVSSVGWFYDSIERTREVARWTSEVTHNHPEGIKGAESTASAIYLARTGASKEKIRDYLESEFGYDLSRTLDEIRPTYHHVEDCMHTMPEAFTCFLEAESYEETLRNVMYIGGDTDTLCAIAGAIAEAFWGIPFKLVAVAGEYLSEDINHVIKRFKNGDNDYVEEDKYANNKFLKMAVERVNQTNNTEDRMVVIQVLLKLLSEQAEAPTPMVDMNDIVEQLDLDNAVVGKSMPVTMEVRLNIAELGDSDGNKWFPLFTDMEELDKQPGADITINYPIRVILEAGLNSENIKGVIINPFGERFVLTKELIKLVMDIYDEQEVHREDN